MRNFRNDRRSGGRDFGGRNDGPKKMFKATCSDCGDRCEVPFKPTGNKPVYCSDCFRPNNDFDRPRSNNRDHGQKNSNRYGSDEKRMYIVTCDSCRSKCEVPFRPTGNKPVYCSDCFANKNDSHSSKQELLDETLDRYEEQFQLLNNKLDRIIRKLETIKPKQSFLIKQEDLEKPKKKTKKTEEKPKKETKKTEEKPKKKAKKTTKKVTKKTSKK